MSDSIEREELLRVAAAAAERAYAPYSHFRVGAAVRDAEGRIFVGCNVENASYGLSNCAERTAVFSAVADGAARPLTAMAVTCLDADPARGLAGCSPCGACRQVMSEHLAADAPIYLPGGTFHISELLPHSFEL